MAVKLDAIPLAGGLDEASGYTAPKAGRLIGCQNFEIVFGKPGYRRIDGYECFDGQASPAAATYYLLDFDTGTAEIAVADTVTGPSGSGYVLRVRLDSGTWVGGDAAGALVLAATTGSFADDDVLQVSAANKALAAGALAAASSSDAAYATDLVLARTYYRGLIAKPVGEGDILGLAWYNEVAYCLRNVVGSATATLWKSSASGWTAVRTGLRPDGALRSVVAGFTGVAGEQALYGVDAKNRPWQLKGATFTFLPAIYDNEGTSTTSLTPGAGAKAFTTTETGRVFANDDEMIAYSAADASIYMIGTVTGSTGSSVTLDVTSYAGATAADWHICRTDGINRPRGIAAHKNHLFLSYPKGQLQHSDLGDPMVYGATAGIVALGDEIVDTRTLRSDVLAITQTSQLSLLYGSSAADWELKAHSQSSNTREGSLQEVGGNGIYLNDAGLISLAGSQAFGDFDAANLATDAVNTMRSVMSDYRCTSLIKTDSQYRVYGASKGVLVMTWAGGTVSPQTVAFTRLVYDHQAVCSAVGTVGGEEYVLFGTDDGWVMRERVGTTFDGENITAFLRTSYWHSKSAPQKKRMRKVTLDCDSLSASTIYFKLDFDFAGPDLPSTINFTISPSGGAYDVDNWNEFFWSNPETAQLEANVEGVGRFMSMLLWSIGDTESYNLYGMAMQYSPLEVKR